MSLYLYLNERYPRSFKLLLKAFFKQRQDCCFFAGKSRDGPAQFAFGPSLERGDPRSVEIGIDHSRMDVTLAADGLGIAEPPGDAFNRPGDVALGGRP